MEIDRLPHNAAGNSSTSVKPKRKKIESPIVSDDDAEAELLKKNAFSVLADKSIPSQSSPIISTPENSSAEKKQPPLVVKNINFASLVEKMKLCDAQPTYKITRFGIKIHCSNAEQFDKVQKYLKACQYEFYTHDKPGERPYRVVLRGLPLVNPSDIQHRLQKEYNLTAQAVHIIKRKNECDALDESFYLVHFAKGHTNLKQLREVKSIAQIIVRWETYRNKRADVTQCMNCLHHGHGTRNCHLKSRCNICGESHATDQCKKKNSSVRSCANCKGTHAASDRNCPKRAEYIQIRQQVTTSNQPGRSGNKKSPPALTTKDFPALTKNSQSIGTTNPVGSQPTFNAWTNQRKQERKIDPRIRAGITPPPPVPSPEGSEGVLYGSDELWSIYNEFCDRMKQCKNKSDQVRVLGYMVCKYGVN